jgi:hypothetical protein
MRNSVGEDIVVEGVALKGEGHLVAPAGVVSRRGVEGRLDNEGNEEVMPGTSQLRSEGIRRSALMLPSEGRNTSRAAAKVEWATVMSREAPRVEGDVVDGASGTGASATDAGAVRVGANGRWGYSSADPIQQQRTKHVEIDLHFVYERVALGDVHVHHILTSSQFVNIFTKSLPSSLFSEFWCSLNICRG